MDYGNTLNTSHEYCDTDLGSPVSKETLRKLNTFRYQPQSDEQGASVTDACRKDISTMLWETQIPASFDASPIQRDLQEAEDAPCLKEDDFYGSGQAISRFSPYPQPQDDTHIEGSHGSGASPKLGTIDMFGNFNELPEYMEPKVHFDNPGMGWNDTGSGDTLHAMSTAENNEPTDRSTSDYMQYSEDQLVHEAGNGFFTDTERNIPESIESPIPSQAVIPDDGNYELPGSVTGLESNTDDFDEDIDDEAMIEAIDTYPTSPESVEGMDPHPSEQYGGLTDNEFIVPDVDEQDEDEWNLLHDELGVFDWEEQEQHIELDSIPNLDSSNTPPNKRISEAEGFPSKPSRVFGPLLTPQTSPIKGAFPTSSPEAVQVHMTLTPQVSPLRPALQQSASRQPIRSLPKTFLPSLSPGVDKPPSKSAVSGNPPKPFLRKPFPTSVRPRPLITGLSTTKHVHTAFRIAEAIKAVSHCPGHSTLIELYAIVTSSHRQGHKQHFTFADVFYPSRPPFLQGTWEKWKGAELWEFESGRFLDCGTGDGLGRAEEDAKKGLGKMARLIGHMVRERGGQWEIKVESIWEAGWEDLEWVRGIVDAPL